MPTGPSNRLALEDRASSRTGVRHEAAEERQCGVDYNRLGSGEGGNQVAQRSLALELTSEGQGRGKRPRTCPDNARRQAEASRTLRAAVSGALRASLTLLPIIERMSL